MNDVLTIEAVDAQANGNNLSLYAWQVVTLKATLLRYTGSIGDQEQVCFAAVTQDPGDFTWDFAPYDDVDAGTWQPQGLFPVGPDGKKLPCVSVILVPEQPQTGTPKRATALLRVLVAKGINLYDSAFAFLLDKQSTISNVLTLSINYPNLLAPVIGPRSDGGIGDQTWQKPAICDGVYLPVRDAYALDPKSARGNFLYYQFEVIGADKKGIPNIRIRLTGDPQDALSCLRLYPSYDSSEPLARKFNRHERDHYDLLTDAAGVATVYVCAGIDEGTRAGWLHAFAQTEIPVGPFVVSDFVPSQGTDQLDAPIMPAFAALQDDQVLEGKIPCYQDAKVGDRIFLFSGCDFQGYLDIANSNQIPSQLGEPISPPIQVQEYGLHSADYGGNDHNCARYVALQGANATASPAAKFYCTGTPPKAEPPALDGGGLLPPPYIVGYSDGWPITSDVLQKGLCVRIPLPQGSVAVGQRISVIYCVNGYRMAPLDDEPWGKFVVGPTDFTVTARMLDAAIGYAEWWFSPRALLGFGQKGGQGATAGSVGTLQVQYALYAAGGDKTTSIPQYSQILQLGIDTIGPTGYQCAQCDCGQLSALEGAAA